MQFPIRNTESRRERLIKKFNDAISRAATNAYRDFMVSLVGYLEAMNEEDSEMFYHLKIKNVNRKRKYTLLSINRNEPSNITILCEANVTESSDPWAA